MVVVPAGTFAMGSPPGVGSDYEHPQHEVTIPQPFAVGVYEVTFAEWDACVAGGGCSEYRREDKAILPRGVL
jgi:formylglycine-generating enzyme required for sulfatase activity